MTNSNNSCPLSEICGGCSLRNLPLEEYRSRKMEYSNSRDEGSKNKMLNALNDFMSGVHGMMKQMFKDADCREEREIIQEWAQRIAEM